MKHYILILVAFGASLSAQQKPASFMGVKFGLPLAKQMPKCVGGFLPNNARCHDNGEFVRWKDEDNRAISVKTTIPGNVWYVERDFPGSLRDEILDDLKAKFGKADCDDHVSVASYWGCQWNTSWGIVIFLWRPDEKDGNNIQVSGGTKAYYAVVRALRQAETAKRRKDESF